MAPQEIDLLTLMRFPYPWPPPETYLICGGEHNGMRFELFAHSDGRLDLRTPTAETSFISQPIEFQADTPVWVFLRMALTTTTSLVMVSGQTLLVDAADTPRLLLTSAQGIVPQEFSINDPDIQTACQVWVENRRAKFGTQAPPRPNRRPKTIQEQVQDFVVSIYRLRVLREQVLAGNGYLLGTLAGEMRACVFWKLPANRDPAYNPVLLRMANLAELPLPVYATPDMPLPASLQPDKHLTLSRVPRIERMFATDKVCDLQDALTSSVLRLGQSPSQEITALESIKELAHTMGAAHYDETASTFLDVLSGMKSADSDQLTITICQTADTLASLSEWVLSELKSRNLIG
jgi:hypothetical protein